MSAPRSDRHPAARSQRPKATTVFAAAFLAGAAAAVGLNRTLDVHLAQRQPRVESEPIFVALRSLPQGAPLTVWDVALRDWPKAMLPAAALRPRDSFDGMVLKHPIREGQPILSVQLVKVSTPGDSQVAETIAVPAATSPATAVPAPQSDLWAPAEIPAPATPPAESVSQAAPAVATETGSAEVSTEVVSTEAVAAESSFPEPVVAEPVVVAATSDTDIEPAVTPAAAPAEAGAMPARETAMRYLVVPERIALEADRSFVPPAEPEQRRTAAAETVVTAPTGRSSSSAAAVQQGRAKHPATRTSSNHDRQPQRPPRSAAGRTAPATEPEKPSLLRSMMPRLSLGMGAVEPESKSKQAPQSTFRGFGLFR